MTSMLRIKSLGVLLCVYASLAGAAEPMANQATPSAATDTTATTGVAASPWVLQSHGNSCGAASLVNLLKFYKQNQLTEAQLLQSIGKSNAEPSSITDIISMAAQQGFTLDAFRANQRALLASNLPVIVFLNDPDAITTSQAADSAEIKQSTGHFVVLEKIEGDTVHLIDSALGVRSLQLNEFARTWQSRARTGLGVFLRLSS